MGASGGPGTQRKRAASAAAAAAAASTVDAPTTATADTAAVLVLHKAPMQPIFLPHSHILGCAMVPAHKLQIAAITVLLSIVMFIVFRKTCSKSRKCHAVPCAAVPCQPGGTPAAAEAALTALANAIYNVANAIVGTLSSWLPQVYSAAGMNPYEVATDGAYQSVMAFMRSDAQIGIQDNPMTAARSLAAAAPLLNDIVAELGSPSASAHAALVAGDGGVTASGYLTVLRAVANDLSAAQSAVNAYVSNK